MKIKSIQVFLAGDDTPEISGELVGFRQWCAGGLMEIKFKEYGFEDLYTMYVPINQIRMVRIYDENDDE